MTRLQGSAKTAWIREGHVPGAGDENQKEKAHDQHGHAPFMQLSGSGLGRIGTAALGQNGGHPVEFRSLHGEGHILYRDMI